MRPICESAFQAGAVLCAGDERDATPAGAVPVLTRIADARFKRMVGPGDKVGEADAALLLRTCRSDGLLLVTNRLTLIAQWFTKMFPGLASIG